MPATAGGRDTLSGNDVIKIGVAKIGTFLIGQKVWSLGRDAVAPAAVVRSTVNPTAGARDIL